MTRSDPRAIKVEELEEAPFPAGREEFRIHVSEEAFDRAVARSMVDTTREIGGVLVGVVQRDKGGPYVRVDTTIDALHAEEKGAELTFTHATWDHIHKEMDEKHAGKKVVGWYHTHPGFGIFLSDRDQFIHKSFFDLPFQVALVYDPKSREHGVFAWRDGAPWRVRRYFVGDHEHVWDGNRDTARRSTDDEEKKKPAADQPSPQGERLLDRTEIPSLILVGLVALVAGGLGGWWYGQRGSDDVIRQAEVEIAKARASGMREAVSALDTEILGLVRTTMAADAVTRPMDRLLGALEQAMVVAQRPGVDPALAPLLNQARDLARQHRDDRNTAAAALRQLDAFAGGRRLDPAAERAELTGTVLANLYADLAIDLAKQGDGVRARRYLSIAARVDPGNRDRYQKLLGEIERGGKLEMQDR